MAEFKLRTLSELREANERVFDPNAGYLDTVGGARLIESGLGNSDAVRNSNFNTSKSRFSLPATDVAKSGISSFNSSRQTTSSISQPEPDIATQYRNLSNADLDRVKGLDNQELQANINRIKQYQPLANNEANRALGMELATRLPYATFEKSADLFGGAKTLASVMGTFDTLRYQKGVSMSL